LQAINNKEKITLVIRGRNDINNFTPEELFVENNEDMLLKVRGDKAEYYLHDIDEVKHSGKQQNPIFSEIYSFYYRIFEKLAKEYKNNKDFDVTETLEKYGTKDTKTLFGTINKNILPLLAELKNLEIPLTTPELRWLKTVMQDPRFDLFVTDEERSCLNDLVDDVEAFDLSAFKIYDKKKKSYKSITDAEIPKGINKDSFREQLKNLNNILFSVPDNAFRKF